MKRILLPFLVLLSFPGFGQKLYDQQLKLLYKNTVPVIYPKALAAQIKEKKVYILDTRTPQEYEVSHLPKARFVNYDSFQITQISDIPKSAAVVVYCSVGVRSERVGEKLLQAGYKQVYNLHGGIFKWKNENYSVYNSQNKVTDSVHTYNKIWAIWLQKGIKVYE